MARLRPTPPRLLGALALAAGVALLLFSLRPRPWTIEEVRWQNGEVELAGSLYLPRGADPHPAAAFVHGHGPAERGDDLFRTHAERLAARGLALLVYDKRGCGASGGDGARATLADLAGDARGALDLLRAHPRVDPARVGLFATSLGGTIALLAARDDSRLAFLAALSLSVFSPAEQIAVTARERVRRAGHPQRDARRAGALGTRVAEVYRTGRGWAGVRAAIEAARGEAWFADAGIELLDEDSSEWRALRDLPMDVSPRELLSVVEIPMFLAQGEEDALVPGPLAVERLRDLGHAHVTLVSVPGAGHTLRVRSGRRFDWRRGWLVERWTWPAAYWDALDAWLERHVHRR